MNEHRTCLTDVLLLGIVIVWGLNFTVVKYSLETFGPLGFNTLRYALAIGFFGLLALRKNNFPRLDRKDILPLVGLSLLGHLLYQLLFIYGINHTKAANAAVMLGTIPIWIAVLSHFFFDERLKGLKLLGVIFGFTGVVTIVIGVKGGFSIRSTTVIGDLTMIAAAFSFGYYSLLSKRFLSKYRPLPLTVFMTIIGGSGIVIAGIPELLTQQWEGISWVAWLGVIYSGLLSIAIAYLIWSYGLKKVGAIRTSAYQNLVPVIGMGFGILLLGEELTLLQGVGAASVIGGIVMTRVG